MAIRTTSNARTKFLRGLMKDPTMLFGLALLIAFTFLALFAPVLSPEDPIHQNISASLTPPGADFLLGTDKLGRDILSRILFGARISLFVGLAVVAGAGFSVHWWGYLPAMPEAGLTKC